MISKIFEFLKTSFSESTLNYIEEAYTRALGTGLYLGMFFLAVIFIIFELKKKEKDRIKLVFGFYSVIVLILAVNPIFANISIKVIGSSVYWRIYWLLPLGIVLAYVFTELIYKMPTKIKRFLASVLIIFIIIVGGKWIYTEENFASVNNYYKIPDTVLDIIFRVSADDEEYKQLAGPLEFEVYTRQVDGTIILSENRSFTGSYREDSIVTYITNGDFENIYKKAKEIGCNYVVLSNSVKRADDDLANHGFLKFYENIDYTVYKLEEENTSWTITQYGIDGDLQSMCYTIEGNNSGLVIVDGGYKDDEETLKILEDKINANGNRVNAWILTHFDEDHAGAYMTLRDRIPDLQVGRLYVQDTPDIETCKENANWYTDEEWALYQSYLDLNISEKQLVHAGDTMENIIGLKMEVLSAYDDWIDEETSNLLNNGSIIFKLYGNEESILFCGDAQSDLISEYLLDSYSDKLKSDYLQVAHHGNNGFSDEFYETVNPKVAFFPSSTVIMENVNNVSWYSTEYLSELLGNMGATIYTFKDSPAEIVMK